MTLAAATFARIPAFLSFRVEAAALGMGPVHAAYDELDRDFSARLRALPGQPIVGGAGTLDALDGTLVVLQSRDLGGEWTGSIERILPMRKRAGVATPDYRVLLELSPPAFSDFLQLVQTRHPLTALVLDFQDIDGPLDEDPLDRPIPWDDVAYPKVALTSFRLNWNARGTDATPAAEK